MRFVEFLKTTVLLTAGAATALGTVSVLAATADSHPSVVWVAASWWVIAAAIGMWAGRRDHASGAIARLLASAKATTTLAQQQPGTILINRLWPLLVLTVGACALGLLAPQVPGIGAGFAILWALGWRRQHAAVAAVEGRDGVRFYVIRTSPLRPIALERVPGLKALDLQQANGAVS